MSIQTNRVICNEIIVKFAGGQQSQSIRFSNGPTSAQRLSVVDDGLRLSIYYLGAQGDIVECIVFPMERILEYHCREVQDRKPMPSQPIKVS